MAGRRQRQDVERAKAPRPILIHDPAERHRFEECETVLAKVVDVVERAGLPVLLDTLDEVPFGRRCPDPDACLVRADESLGDVPVVVGEQDVGDAGDAELGEVFEHVAASEVDEDRLVAASQQVDVDGVGEPNDVGRDEHRA